VLAPQAIAPRAAQTESLLKSLALGDPLADPSRLRALVRSLFLMVQKCWEARDYSPVKALLFPSLHARHEALLAGLRRQHLINRLANLSVERLELVHVHWPKTEKGREFAVLITFRAQSTYVDDRTGALRSGSAKPARFQEFWVFRRLGKGWGLCDIEPTRQSDRLSRPNFVAP
jgi:predicted lipid-binding transport protein (Tim44 family)